MLNNRDQKIGGAILVLDERFADAGLVGQVFGGVGKKSGQRFRASDCADKNVDWNREKRFLRAGRDHLIRII